MDRLGTRTRMSGVTTPPTVERRETSPEDRARTSHLSGEQAPAEQGSEVGDCHHHEGLRVDKKD